MLSPPALGSGAGFRLVGRFAGGTGGVGLPDLADPLSPFATGALGTGREATGGGGGGGGGAWLTISSTYADGTQPCTAVSVAELPIGRASHQPFGSLRTIMTTSPFFTLISPAVCPAKSQRARQVGSWLAAAETGGGGGGGTLIDTEDELRAWADPFRAAMGCDTALDSLIAG